MKYLTTIIKEHRKLLGLSQHQVAIQLRISQQSYSLLEKNPAKITLEKMLEISKILNFSLSKALLAYESEKPLDHNSKNTELLHLHKDMPTLVAGVR